GTLMMYPVFLKLDGLPVVVVGGGKVAAGKIDGLVAAGAKVTVVAPDVCPAVRAHAVRIVERAYLPSDLDGARWVVAAAPREINAAVAEEAARRGVFVNAVDDTASSTAYLGGVVRRDGVTLAISTEGVAPALAGLLREAVDALLPADLSRWVDAARAA